MRTYFLPNNLGKEAITLNLRSERGQELLKELVRKLPVDIVASNLKPSSYAKLGMDYEILREVKPDLIWLGITGFGPQSDEGAYDPILQARSGFMELTGEEGGTPQVFGLPMVDLAASEHAYGQIMKALFRQAATGEGSRIDISMFQGAVSFMVNPILLTKCFGETITRRGNTHQFFAPVSVYPTRDGHVYLAVGNDKQWKSIVGLPGLESLDLPEYERNAGRIEDVQGLNERLGAVVAEMTTEEALALFREAGIPVARVNTIPDVADDPLVRDQLVWATDPVTGKEICVAPPAVETDFLREREHRLSFPPRHGEHNETIYGQIGYTAEEITQLRSEGIV
jgi:formyl-CoA transferase